ncbi:hypothetical protein [Pseudodesulfovibrio sp.]|uniref:hypothetical protein n=1 Tax=Pseudodesulfovibrio sp. TaxID=2035812 RepID=UPI002634E598|nr:hypothetical protein [Pseudodesulfovibrio sp.]MDD3311534.1 hypothetical protein [Pseudodesulfovibrio sp.]
MKGHQEFAENDGVETKDVRHCSVCFAVIPKGAPARRSLEGHCYCEQCSKGFFKEVNLRGLRQDCCRLPREEQLPA